MELPQQELRTPPLPLVVLVGVPDAHRALGTWASQALRPPLMAYGVAEPSEATLAAFFGERGRDPWAAVGGSMGAVADTGVSNRSAARRLARTLQTEAPCSHTPNAQSLCVRFNNRQAGPRRPSPLRRRRASSRPTG